MTDTSQLPETLNAEKAAEVLYCKPSTIEKEANAGRLQGAKIGSGWIFRASDVASFLELRIAEEQSRIAKGKGKNKQVSSAKNAPPSLND